MNTVRTLAPAVLLASALFAPVQAAVYVTNPVQGSVCHGGHACPVEWVDDGNSPLLSAIGTCDVGLYTGEYVLAQDLGPVDVSSTSSFSFTPNPAAGPNGPYYLVFSNPSISYTGFSGSFNLDSMTGTTPGGGGGSSGTESSTGTGASTTTPTGSPTGTGTETSSTSTTSTGTETVTTTFTGTETITTTLTGTETATTTLTSPVTTTATTTITTPVTTTITTTFTSTTSHTTTTTHTTTSTPTNAAVRDGSSGSLALALFLACAGVLAF